MLARKALLVAMLLLAAACGQASGGKTPVTPVGTGDPQGTTGSLIATDAGPVGLTVDTRGRVWVASADAGTVSRLTAAGDGVDLTRRVGAAPLRLTRTTGAVWVTVFSDGLLLRLDDRSGQVTDKITIGAEPEGITAAFGSVWVVLQASAELLRVDPARGRIIHRYSLGVAPRLVTPGLGSLWVSDFGSGRIFRLDPTTGEIRRSAALCFGPQGMLVEATAVWVACTTDDVLVELNPHTLQQVAKLPLPGSPDALAAGPDGQLLVALQKGPTLAVVDPSGPTVVRRDRLGSVDQLYDRANIDVVYHDGLAWVSSYLEAGVYRVTP